VSSPHPSTDVRSRLDALARRSVAIIRDGQASSGAYVASPDFPVYRYCWLRDGSFIADAMSRAGHDDSAEAFFVWCAGVVGTRGERIAALVARARAGEDVAPDELLHCRYTVDGEESGEQWWNFQPDGYGAWLWALAGHTRRHGGLVEPYAQAIDLTVRYLAAFWAEPSYDWWEEHLGRRHTSTLASIQGGLSAVASLEGLGGSTRSLAAAAAAEIRRTIRAEGVDGCRLVKWLGGDSIDASLIACATPFRVFAPGDPVVSATVAALENGLAHGGVHRYPGDSYYGGGEWLLLAALLGWHYAEIGRTADAWRQLVWVADQANDAGELPEQVDRCLIEPHARAEWLERWGPVATPLLWSHAMYLTLALELGAVRAPVPAAT
jgi:GH15 family glucan-1,4-alpha-glucosidase